MKTCLIAKRLVWLTLATLASLTSHSQTRNTTILPETMVTATRTEQPLVDLVADVSIIDRDQIERSGATGVADVLARVPGIEMSRNGGPGNTTNLYVRGAEPRFTAVFIDGVRVDTQSGSGGATWEAVPLSQIDHIEIVRGPASAVYGSDAMGGVIQIFTRKGQGPLTPFVGVGLGTYGTRKWEGGFSGSQGKVDYAFSLAREVSSGFNARPPVTYNPDDDGYVSESFSGRFGWQLNDAHRLDARVLSSNNDAQYDYKINQDDHTLHLLQTKGLNWRAKWSDSYSTRVSVTESRDQYETKPSVYLSMTRLNGYLFQNEFRVGAHLLTAALERKVDYLENSLTSPTGAIVRDRSQDALALGYSWRQQQHSLQLNARHDQDSEFGGKGTGSAAYGYALTSQWRVTSSVGTAFRVPTLYQRFSSSGLASLQPETSRNMEAGIRYTEGSTSWGVVAYQNQVSNLITFVKGQGTCPNNTPPVPLTSRGCYFNTAHAEYAGLTISGQQRLAAVNLTASLDIQAPRDVDTGNFLARRANHHATVGLSTSIQGWSLGGDAQLSGARYDYPTSTTTVQLPAYVLFNLFAQTRITREWTALLRLNNATDTQYQLASDYATPGRSLYVALKWAPQ